MSESKPDLEWRITSTLGPRYMTPVHFASREAAQDYLNEHRRLLADLPGGDTLRIEYRQIPEWKALDD